MIESLLPPSFILLLALPGANGAGAQRPTMIQYGEMTIHQRILVRLPLFHDAPVPDTRFTPVKPTEWREKKGPRCVALSAISGASFSQTESLDLLVVDGQRLRARFSDQCTAIDYYSGAYLKPAPDGQVCAKRDSIRSRSGHPCLIQGFKRLTPKRE